MKKPKEDVNSSFELVLRPEKIPENKNSGVFFQIFYPINFFSEKN